VRVDTMSAKGPGKGIPVVEEDALRVLEAHEEDHRVPVEQLDVRLSGLIRELLPLAGSQIEEEDLWRLFPGRIGTEIAERDPPAIGTDREDPLRRDRADIRSRGEMRREETAKATGVREPPEAGPVGAHEEDPVARGRQGDEWLHREPLRYLEDHSGAIRQHRQAVEDAGSD